MNESMQSNDKHINEIKTPLNEIFKDMAKYAPSKVFGLAGNLVVVPIYTNLLSPHQYGIYAISVAVLSFLCIIFSDWVGLSGLRFFKHHQIKEQIPKYLSTLVMLLIMNIFVMFFLAFIFRHSFYDFFKIPHKVFILVLFMVIPVAVRALLFQILRAQIKPGAFTISTIANQILTILISVFIIKFYHLGAISILLGMAISISFIDLILIYQSNIFSYFKFDKPHFGILTELYKYGVPIAIAGISLWLITQSNKFILQHFHGYSKVGLVGVGYNLTFPILMTLFAVLTIAAVPRIINLYEAKIDVRPIISKLTEYFILVSLPIITIMCFYSKEIVLMFANERFADAYVLLPYLAFSCFFLSLSDYTTLQYDLIKKTYINTAIKVTSSVVGVILNFILIQKMGIIGVGIATLIANILYFVLSIIIVIPNLNWQVPYKKICLILISFIPTWLAYTLLKQDWNIHFIWQISILLIVYYSFYALINNSKQQAQ